MSNVDLSALLSKKSGEIEKPKPLPPGHYGWNVGKHEATTSAKKGTPGIVFYVTPFEAKEDVDQDLLAEVKEPVKKERKLTFWLTEDSLFRLTDFLKVLGVDDPDKELIELLPETMGTQFIAPIKHEMRQDSDDVMAILNDNAIAAYE